MRKELGNWNPSHWSHSKLRLFTRNVKRHAILACTDLLGPYDGALAGAELLATLESLRSLALLHALGVKTLAEVQDGANSKA